MITCITSEQEHEQALKQLMSLMDTSFVKDSVEEVEFMGLVTLIEQYEQVHYPIELPTIEESAIFRKEQE